MKKFLSTLAVLLALTVTACGGAKDDGSSKKPAGSSVHKHSYVVDEAAGKAATCDAPGEKVEKCACGDVKKTPIPQLEHTFAATAEDAETLLVHPELCSNNCNTHAYRLDIAQATGWNKSTVKWNAKTTDAENNQVEASWDITGKIPAGKYSIQLEALMSYTSHGDRYFYNQWETDSGQNADKQSESPFRYFFKVNGGEAVNPTTKDSWGTLGYEGSNDSGSPKWATVVSEVTIPEGATSFSAFHGDIGYSLIVSRVRLVEIKAA